MRPGLSALCAPALRSSLLALARPADFQSPFLDRLALVWASFCPPSCPAAPPDPGTQRAPDSRKPHRFRPETTGQRYRYTRGQGCPPPWQRVSKVTGIWGGSSLSGRHLRGDGSPRNASDSCYVNPCIRLPPPESVLREVPQSLGTCLRAVLCPAPLQFAPRGSLLSWSWPVTVA